MALKQQLLNQWTFFLFTVTFLVSFWTWLHFWRLIQKSPSRNISGITSVTVLTSPYPNGQKYSCKHDCFYCPNEPAHEGNNWVPQPRSYLSKEPAVQRANRNKFDAILQTQDRLNSLLSCGHKCDKLEFIIEGGTFTEYPKPYLKRFSWKEHCAPGLDW